VGSAGEVLSVGVPSSGPIGSPRARLSRAGAAMRLWLEWIEDSVLSTDDLPIERAVPGS
jgi:hypothetical protein